MASSAPATADGAAGVHDDDRQGSPLEHDPGGNRSCSVPARLIDERVRVLLHHDHLEVYFAGKLVERLPRIRGQRPARVGKGSRTLTRAGGFIRFSATPMRLTAYAIESIVKTDGGMVEVEGTEEFEA